MAKFSKREEYTLTAAAIIGAGMIGWANEGVNGLLWNVGMALLFYVLIKCWT